jgi:hypothetical protein
MPILDPQILHKYIKCEHTSSSRDLLQIISISVGKYLYAGEIRQKTNLKEQGIVLPIQGKRLRLIRVRHSASHGSMGPQRLQPA